VPLLLSLSDNEAAASSPAHPALRALRTAVERQANYDQWRFMADVTRHELTPLLDVIEGFRWKRP
jgi:hypothetical protein